MKNIVLIGMPGSGKTTISEALSQKTGWPVIDLDSYLENYFHQTIADMFMISEKYFRDHETEVCQLLKDSKKTILSCGGGVVLRKENIQYLKQNGIICLLNRDINKIVADIDTSNRPLLKEGKERLYTLYEQRWPLYMQYADVVIDNNGTVNQTLTQIEKYM